MRSVVLLLLLSLALPLGARSHKPDSWAKTQFDNAEHLRDSLNERAAADRTRHRYQQVVNAYRRVYYGAPTSSKADPSVVAVAELLLEMGRQYNDEKLLHSAISQYEFLRREYPGSKYRFDALLTIGEIHNDLNETTKAREVFQEFLRRYPRNELAKDAHAALEEQSIQRATSKTQGLESINSKQKEADEQAAIDDTGADSGDATVAKSPAGPNPAPGKTTHVTAIRHWSTPDYTRVAIDLDREIKFESQRIEHPNRIFFDLLDAKLASSLAGKTFSVDDGFLNKIRVAQFQPGKTRVVLEVGEASDYDASLQSNPSRLVINIHAPLKVKTNSLKEVGSRRELPGSVPTDTPPPILADTGANRFPLAGAAPLPAGPKPIGPTRKIVEADDESPDDSAKPVTRTKSGPVKTVATRVREMQTREAQPTSGGSRSLIRALGLKIGKIVIDPGHGGHDTGTIGPNGLEEKDLVLDVSRRLGKLLEGRMGADVIYTRSDDTFIPLETRTSIANQEQADLFVSVHANSSHDEDARGVETYYLNFTSSSEALDVAARENSASEKSIHELQDLVKKIALKEKIEESHEFASDVQKALHSGLAAKSPGIRDRGVKKAPFVVLIGANMPSILAEISFISNPGDERRLQSAEYRQRIAESLYRGISKYVGGLSGVKVASRMGRNATQ
ncbi:MAG: N-acetylmuramoyl-L-alanine amidase [Acidobacteriota bacterium]|nr:N-acetylmuramoyl-L-alanine amidase [Acidobacteriota bacterium]